jgi:hypothetical protein
LFCPVGANISTYTFTSNATMKGNIEYSKAGEYVSVSKGNNQTFDQGHGVITTRIVKGQTIRSLKYSMVRIIKELQPIVQTPHGN